MMKQRETAYDNLKFVLIVLVVILHCSDFYTEGSPAFRSVYIFIYTFVMPAFVFVSGLFGKSALRDKRRALQRALWFLVLYVLCKILLTIPSMILSGARFDLLRESGIPWFMLSMAWWALLTFLVKDLPAKAVFGGSVLLACLAGYVSGIGDFLCLSKTIVFYPFFLAGYYLNPRDILEKARAPLLRAVGAAGFLLLFYLAFFKRDAFYALRPLFSAREAYQALPHPMYGALYRFLHYPAAGVLICGLLAWIPRGTTPFSVCGQRTLQVYFLHYIFLYPLKLFPIVQKLPAAAGVAVAVAACAFVACVLSLRLFSVPFDWLQKRMFHNT